MEEQRTRRQLADPNEFPKLGTTAERAAVAATERSTSRSRKNSRDRSSSKRRSASRQWGRSKRARRLDGRRKSRNKEEGTVAAAEPSDEWWR
ncbi:hypothetical protein MRX96_009055 [Rhipicephalus microplus]